MLQGGRRRQKCRDPKGEGRLTENSLWRSCHLRCPNLAGPKGINSVSAALTASQSGAGLWRDWSPSLRPAPFHLALGAEPVSGDSRGKDTCGMTLSVLQGRRKTCRTAAGSCPFTRGSRLGRASYGSKANIWGKKRAQVLSHFHPYVTTRQSTQTGRVRPPQGVTPVTLK